ncbi:hypothetical protein [Roseovarius nitratireducens]|uniref:hypothetical protein n=1 Tax=Roseovarius nitratireducens TaxID=2044597 RepID=UPI000CE28E62|nr:hypothetical protein [Roseovarius nitratireducens]
MRTPVLFVTGLGRCGTTMVMQMLQAAGVPCAGTHPAFEDIPVTPSGVDHEWLALQAGRAVKWIDPTVTRVRHPNGAAIFLTRDPVEQAKSQLKMIGTRNDRTARRVMAKSIQRDTRHARSIVTNLFGAHFVLHLHYDKILRDPAYAAAQTAYFCDMLGLPFGPSGDAAAVVHKRGADCAPDLRAEIAMLPKD